METDELLRNEFSPYKLFNSPDRIQSLLATGDCFPLTVELDLTNFCNHKCKCCVDPVHGKEMVTLDFVQNLINDLQDAGVKAIVLKGGGESIIHPDFPEIVSLIGRAGFDLGIVTNGSKLVNDAVSQALVANAKYVRVSYNGPTRELFYMMHGVDQFEQINAGVRKLIAMRTAKNPIVGLSFPFDIHNISGLDHAISLTEELDADYALLRPFFYEEVGYVRQMNATQAVEIRRNLVEAVAGYRGKKALIVGQFVADFEYRRENLQDMEPSSRNAFSLKRSNGIEHEIARCYAHPLVTAITADGRVWGCCNLRNYPDYSFGRLDYKSGVTFRTIWQGDGRRRVRQKIDHARCLAYCTHALSRYNEFLHYMLLSNKNHNFFL